MLHSLLLGAAAYAHSKHKSACQELVALMKTQDEDAGRWAGEGRGLGGQGLRESKRKKNGFRQWIR